MKLILKCIVMLLLLVSCGNIYAQLKGQALTDSMLKELPRQRIEIGGGGLGYV